MTRKLLLTGALCALVTGAVSASPLTAGGGLAANPPATGTAGTQTRPNIVLITTDDQSATDLRAMPSVQSLLANHGTTFSHFYTPDSLCAPSRASILTGQYPHNHGVLENTPPQGGYGAMNPSGTFAVPLTAAGYTTALVGKYVNGYGQVPPVTAPPGWSDWHGEIDGGNYYQTHLVENGGTHVYNGPYQVDLVSQISTRIIARDAPKPAPFFLWESYFAPHVGLPTEPGDPAIGTPAVPARFRGTFAGTPLLKDPSFNEADVTDKPAYVAGLSRLTSRMQSMLKNSYEQRLESLQAVDEAVKATVDALRSAGELSNTIIVFTTDNGWMMGQHRIHAGKTVPYEQSIRLPLVIRGPGFPAGVTRAQIVGDIDFAPTFLAAAHANPGGMVIDGTSLLGVAASPSVGTRRNLLLETGPSRTSTPRYSGVRTNRWTYVHYQTGETELYDMAKDPYELDNQASNPAYAAQRRRLAGVVKTLRQCAGATCR